jgi:uncharacterized protein (TIGR02147 family)
VRFWRPYLFQTVDTAELSVSDILNGEFARRRAKNDGYSLRSFARCLQVSPGFLSQVSKNQRRLSVAKAQEIVRRLEFSAELRHTFLRSVLASHSSWETAQAIAPRKKERNRFHAVPLKVFARMNDWCHSALQELPYIEGFRSDPEWIAKRLGMSLTQAREAIREVVATGLLAWKEDKLEKTHHHVRIEGNIAIPSRLLRELHLSFLKRAVRAIRNENSTTRVFGGVTMAIDPAKLPEANERMKRFREEMMEFLEDGKRTAVYHFSMQLFRLDKSGE